MDILTDEASELLGLSERAHIEYCCLDLSADLHASEASEWSIFDGTLLCEESAEDALCDGGAQPRRGIAIVARATQLRVPATWRRHTRIRYLRRRADGSAWVRTQRAVPCGALRRAGLHLRVDAAGLWGTVVGVSYAHVF